MINQVYVFLANYHLYQREKHKTASVRTVANERVLSNESHAFTLNRAFRSAVKTTFTRGLVYISRHAPDIKLGKVIPEHWPVNHSVRVLLGMRAH